MPPGCVALKAISTKTHGWQRSWVFVCPRFPAKTSIRLMSKTITEPKNAATRERAEVGPTMQGSEILVAALEREGVETIFAYPGGASMELHQALTRSKRIRTILPRHEQGGAFAAEGYARATGRAGVCMATSGPGATNLVTGLAMVDMPKNVQQQRTQPVFPKEMHLRGYDPDKKADDVALNEIIGLIEKSERPVLYCGGGIITGNASEELLRFAETTGIPVTTTIMGVGAFPESHPLSLRWLGMHGTAYANWAVSGEFRKEGDKATKVAPGADLLLAFGVRFDDRVTGKVDKFCETGTIVHIDIDASELNKNKPANLPIVSDIRYALHRLNEMIRKRPIQKKFPAWHKQITEWKAKAPLRYRVTEEVLKSQHMRDHMDGKSSEVILPQMVMELLYELTKGEAIISTGVCK